MMLTSELGSMIRGLASSNLTPSQYEEILGMLLERAFEESLETKTVKQSTPKKSSSIPSKGTLLRHVYDSVLAGVGTARDIRVYLEGKQISTTEQRTSAALVGLERRGLLTRTGRGSYSVVAR